MTLFLKDTNIYVRSARPLSSRDVFFRKAAFMMPSTEELTHPALRLLADSGGAVLKKAPFKDGSQAPGMGRVAVSQLW